MKILRSMYWIAVLVSVLLAGCTTAVKMDAARSLSKEQAIVFGKVNVSVDGKHIKMTTSGFKSYLTIEFRQQGSSTIMEYKVGKTGYFSQSAVNIAVYAGAVKIIFNKHNNRVFF